jgi:DNA invertase Pin-like site-specific DNA recombinase
MTTVDGYTRVSTDPQEENTSFEEQERAIRQYCAENGLTVGIIHRETFTGYQYRERKKLETMRQRYRDGLIQGVVVRTLDRLSRSQTHVAILMEEMEREKILDRTITGRVNAAKNGKIVSGVKPLYGWQWHDAEAKDYLILDDDQARVLQRAAEEYANGESLYQIVYRFADEGIPPPKGETWHIRTLRRILTDPRMTGENVMIFTVKNKRAKQPLDSVELPAGTYPRILNDELYTKVLDRAETNAALSTRNSRNPERFLLRAGFARCVYCDYVLTTQTVTNRKGTQYPMYMCPNQKTDCNHFRVPAPRLDEEVWGAVARLADHIPLLEQSIELAMKTRNPNDDLRAIEATLAEWQQTVKNYEHDLADNSLRGDTCTGISHLLDNAYAMVERLENDRAEVVVFQVDRDKEREEYEKILEWCRKVKSEREPVT